jgi:HSP20 family protein
MTAMTNELIPWFPTREFTRLQDEFDKFFGRDAVTPYLNDRKFFPPLDFSETKDSYILKMELPGMDANDIKVTCHGGLLTIRGEKRTDREDKDKMYHRRERTYGAFTRTIQLPGPVEDVKVTATVQKGVLEVEIPKTVEQKSREIPVTVK